MWPYENGQPARCSRCGCAPAVRLADRAPGPWCAAHIPWRPVVPSWGLGKCRKCRTHGALVVDDLGRISGPWCRTHVPPGWPFPPAADRVLEVTLDRLAERRPRRRAAA